MPALQTYRVLYAWRRLALEAAAERRALRKAAVVAGIFTLRTAWRRWRALRARRALLRRVLQRMEAAWEVRHLSWVVLPERVLPRKQFIVLNMLIGHPTCVSDKNRNLWGYLIVFTMHTVGMNMDNCVHSEFATLMNSCQKRQCSSLPLHAHGAWAEVTRILILAYTRVDRRPLYYRLVVVVVRID